MEKEKILLILHYSPPVHGASKVGDEILKSKLLKTTFKTRFIKIQSSESIKSIGSFDFKKIIKSFVLFFNVLFNLIFFNPRKIYFSVSPKGFAFYRDLIISLPIKLYARIMKCEVFYHYHANGIKEFTSKSILHKKLMNFFVKKINIILISEKVSYEVKDLYTYNNLFFLENGVKNPLKSVEFLKIIEEREKCKSLNILFLSNIIKTKGYDTVLKLANELKSKGFKNYTFHFAGSWNSQEDKIYFNNFVESNKLNSYIKYHGLVMGQKKKELFSLAKMFIFPTRYPKEVFPLSLLEALSYGLPVLTFNKGAISNIISNDVGLISNQQNIYNDFIKMEKFYLNKEVFSKCRSRFVEKYMINVFEKKLVNIFMLKDECSN